MLRLRFLPATLLILAAACVDPLRPAREEPTDDLVFATPEEVAALAATSVNQWYAAATGRYPVLMLQVAADALTSNTCGGTRFNNLEPRLAYSNNALGGDAQVASAPWRFGYEALRSANGALGALNDGLEMSGNADANERTRAAALFTQAAVHSNFALIFDSAFVNTARRGPATLTRLRGYREVRDSALALWDALIELTEGKAWAFEQATLPLTVGAPTAERINRIAHTMAARTLMLSARTAAENTATDWARVLRYAEKGITGAGRPDMDFGLVDASGAWFDYLKGYGNTYNWVRVDQRIINRMASNIPVGFNGLTNQPVPVPEDNRLAIANLPCVPSDPRPCVAGSTTDYVYIGEVMGDVGRGIYLQSPFWHRRWINASYAVPSATYQNEPAIHVLAAENDLMIAEALARTGGDLNRAASLVNKTHVGRGGRAPVGPVPDVILTGVEYERDVELLNTGAIALMDRRRVNGLQPYTPRHLPVPAVELERLGKPVYTYGGAGNRDM